ncbi:MAG: hypothetical protein GY698_17020 [Actinomycetia bacterium]|nr:hypothetical protein [Actinomycetes bacterium]
MTIPDSVSIPEWAQGRPGMGQGGYSAFHFGRIIGEVWAGEHYAVVAFEGRWSRGWDGRKKGAGACLFDESGELVARSDSLWVAHRSASSCSPTT